MKEDLFISIIKQVLPESACFIGDDTAYIPEKDLILTQDTMIEDIHFRTRTISPYYLGRKSIAVNLSDIAAAGGVPEYILISLSMPKNIETNFLREYYKGVHSICREYNCLVVGGDLTAAEKITISICAIGAGKGLIPANRRNAKPGDIIVVTGNFGSSKAGFLELEKGHFESKFIQAHINPIPKVNEGRKILQIAGKPAMMDSSDGLADALYKISLLSNVCIDIEFDQIPYENGILKDWVLFGGEDYELVASISEEAYEKLRQDVFIKKIGRVIQSSTNPFVNIRFNDKTELRLDSTNFGKNSGLFNHFE